jgi:hypothetical protein
MNSNRQFTDSSEFCGWVVVVAHTRILAQYSCRCLAAVGDDDGARLQLQGT